MTRLAVLGDIHGNLPALDAVLADIEAQGGVDQVVIAGDVINWGPFSAEVMARVSGHDWAIIRGNGEYYLLEYNTPRQPAHWQEYDLLPWLYDQLKGHWHRVIAAWPDEITLRFPDAPPIRVFHGQPNNPWRSLHPLMSDDEMLDSLNAVDTQTIIAAHSHLALDRHVGDYHLINPGSVGVPLAGEHIASYALLEGESTGWTAMFRQLPFDLQVLLDEYERQCFVEHYGIQAQFVIKEFETARLQMLPFYLWRQAHYPNVPVDETLVAQFTQADRWQYTPLEYHINHTGE